MYRLFSKGLSYQNIFLKSLFSSVGWNHRKLFSKVSASFSRICYWWPFSLQNKPMTRVCFSLRFDRPSKDMHIRFVWQFLRPSIASIFSWDSNLVWWIFHININTWNYVIEISVYKVKSLIIQRNNCSRLKLATHMTWP